MYRAFLDGDVASALHLWACESVASKKVEVLRRTVQRSPRDHYPRNPDQSCASNHISEFRDSGTRSSARGKLKDGTDLCRSNNVDVGASFCISLK